MYMLNITLQWNCKYPSPEVIRPTVAHFLVPISLPSVQHHKSPFNSLIFLLLVPYHFTHMALFLCFNISHIPVIFRTFVILEDGFWFPESHVLPDTKLLPVKIIQSCFTFWLASEQKMNLYDKKIACEFEILLLLSHLYQLVGC